MSVSSFMCDSTRAHMATKKLDLSADVFKVALTYVPSTYYAAWSASTVYALGAIRRPSTRNGHRYIVTTIGTSGASTPTWTLEAGATVSDGTVVWTEYGGDMADYEFFNQLAGPELPTGNGYTEGGETLSGLSVTTAGPETSWDADDTTWLSLQGAFNVAWIYAVGTTPGTDDYLIGYVVVDADFSDVYLSGIDFIIKWSASGIMEMGR